MRIILSLALLWLASVGADAQTPVLNRIDIVEAGIYRTEIVKITPDPNDPTGFLGTVDKIKLVDRSTKVLAKKGVEFGVRYSAVGAPKDEVVDVRVVVRFPADGLSNPKTGEKYFRTEWVAKLKIGGSSFSSYILENDWEVVPGIWVFELWYRDSKFAEQSFTLTKP